MRGLLPGARQKDVRIAAAQIVAPRFFPRPTPAELEHLQKLEMGLEPPPKVFVDQSCRLIMTDHGDILWEENWRNWRLLKLAAFSYVPMQEVDLSPQEHDVSSRRINSFDRAFVLNTNVIPGDFEEEVQEEGEDEGTPVVLTRDPDWEVILDRVNRNVGEILQHGPEPIFTDDPGDYPEPEFEEREPEEDPNP